MGKYRGADGWIHYDSEERPRRYKKDDPVGHAPKGSPSSKVEVKGDGACAAIVLIGSASAVLLSLCLALGFLRKVLSWLWS
jgi:hypothetical protein